jgi:galactokinase
MRSHERLLRVIQGEYARRELACLYGDNPHVVAAAASRYADLVKEHARRLGSGESSVRLFTAPGRVEVGGNHTDHNHGRVLSAAVNLDAIAAARRTSDDTVTVLSEGYAQPFVVDLADLETKDSEKGNSIALIRGICRSFRENGLELGGFDACVASDVAVGSGLSSSAAFEVLIATILNVLYNDGSVPPKEIALIGQYAENYYFGKPSGLMDQTTAAVGGLLTIDFQHPDNPSIQKVDFDFDSCGYDLVVANTGDSHADLTEHYASVPHEMKEVAAALGANVLRESSMPQLLNALGDLRPRVGDRAILRAIHFFADHQRVAEQVQALKQGDFQRFLTLVAESGRSSWMFCQNVYAPERPREQGLSLALALAEQILQGRGACRVHGGGFAGTILAFVPQEMTAEFVAKIDGVFGNGAATLLRIRPSGAREILEAE